MEIKEFENELNKYLYNMEINLDERQIFQLFEYMKLLIEWNKRINLTAITDQKEIILKHFIDSLTINKYIEKNAKIIDVGTGAGFPGIPLKIVRPDIDITLVDSLNKRIKFLDYVIEEIKLKSIKTVHSRAEEIGRNELYREEYDVATSRAVANTAVLSEYLIPLIKEGGKCIYMKGPDIKKELSEGKKAINVLGGTIFKIDEFNLPKTDINRTIVIIKKEKKTPYKYPRKPGTPTKEPII